MSIERISDQLTTMLRMQDTLNIVIDPDWRNAGWALHRAIYVELVELVDHIGWKWWKHSVPNIPDAKMEVIDIWHFMLSQTLRAHDGIPTEEDYEEMSANIIRFGLYSLLEDVSIDFDQLNESSANMRLQYIRNTVDNYLSSVGIGQYRVNDYHYLDVITGGLGMTMDEVFAMYVGKNVLNSFRQEKGYKTGEYIKDWDGEEDNVHLLRILKTVPAEMSPGTVPVYIREMLNEIYVGLQNKQVMRSA